MIKIIGDIISIQKKHIQNGKKVFDYLIQNKQQNIVLIYGSPGCGKTETSMCLQEELYKYKLKSLAISLDDYYITLPNVRNSIRKEKGISSVGLSEIDWFALQDIIFKFKKNAGNIVIQRMDKYLGTIEYSVITNNIDYLIFEGLFAGHLAKFKGNGKIGVYLEGNIKQTYAFRKMRMKENPDNAFRKRVIKKEVRVVSQLKRYAELVIPFEEEK